jgi:hypothetical protein
VFKRAPLFCSCSICIVLWMGLKGCVCSIRCLAKLEEWLAVLKAFLCSLKHVAKFLPVCPTYAFPHSGHVNLYTPDHECTYICLLLFMIQQSLYSVLISEGNLHVGFLEHISDESSFFSNVREGSPLWCLCACSYLFLISVWGWLWSGRVDWEGIVVWDVLDGSNLRIVVVFL